MLMIYFDFWALIFVVLSFGFSVLLYYRKTDKLHKATKLNFMLVFSISMLFLIYALTDLTKIDRVGKWLSFIILSNAYAGIIKTIELIVSGIRKK